MKNSLIKNSIFNFLYKFFDICVPIISSVYVSRVLMAEGVGRVAYAQTIATYFLTFAALGLPNYGVRVIAANGTDKEGRKRTFSELYVVNLVSTILMIIAYYGVVLSVNSLIRDRDVFLAIGLMIVANLFNIEWFFQGTENYRFIAIRSMVVKIGILLPIFFFVKSKEDCLIYACIVGGMYLVTQLLNLPYIIRNFQLTRAELKIRKHLKPIIVLFASSVASEIYALFDVTMLGALHGNLHVGYYSNAANIVRMFFSLITACIAIIYPRISQYAQAGSKDKVKHLVDIATETTKYIMIPATLGVIVVADYIIYTLYGQGFLGSIQTLKILALLLILFSYSYTRGHLVLLAYGKEKVILRCVISSVICNIVLNSILIPGYKQAGAALASVIGEFLLTILLLKEARKLIGKEQGESGLKIFVLSVVFLIVLIFLRTGFDRLDTNIAIKFIGYVVCAIICYIILSLWWLQKLVYRIKTVEDNC